MLRENVFVKVVSRLEPVAKKTETLSLVRPVKKMAVLFSVAQAQRKAHVVMSVQTYPEHMGIVERLQKKIVGVLTNSLRQMLDVKIQVVGTAQRQEHVVIHVVKDSMVMVMDALKEQRKDALNLAEHLTV